MEVDHQPIYIITVNGILEPGWSDCLGTLSIRHRRLKNGVRQTILSGPVPDQSALRGILTLIWDLNLELVAVRQKQPAIR